MTGSGAPVPSTGSGDLASTSHFEHFTLSVHTRISLSGGSLATVVTRSMLLLLAVCGLSLLPLGTAHAKGDAKKQASIIIDANTGRVLHDQDGDELRFPASLTKMMTLYMLFGEIEQGRLTYDSKIRISERANGMAPSKLGLEVGEEIAVIDCIKALVVKSANDIAVAVAERIGGSEYQFASMMTERARQIGMRNTTFRNASGLPNPAQFSTARDMTILALRLQDDYPQHYKYFSLPSFEYGGKVYKSHNTLMRGFPGMDGVKTGYTRASGFNLVSSVRADGKHIVGAVFGGKTAATRNALMRSLLYAALQDASTSKTREPAKLIASARKPSKPAPVLAAAAPPPAPAPAAKKKVAVAALTPSNVPLPVRAARRQPDAIAQVLSTEKETATPPPASTPPPAEPVAVAQLPAPGEEAQPAESPRLDLQALREAMSDAEIEEKSTAAATEDDAPSVRAMEASAGTPAMQASAGTPQDIAGLIRKSLIDGAPAPTTPPSGAQVADASGAVARPASTLGAQANALGASDIARGGMNEDGSPAHAALLAAHEPSAPRQPTAAPSQPSATGGKGYEIQIGAFSTPDEAKSKIDGVRSRAVALLEGHNGVTLPFQKADRQVYRARFVNFDEPAASATCLELRRLAVDCLVMRAE